jgi:hypothetical protein
MSSNLPLYIICSGFHSSSLTANFFTYLATIINDINEENTLIIPLDHIQPYDGLNIYQYIIDKNKRCQDSRPIIFIGFSAGVVGAIIAGNLWQKNGGKVKVLFAFDGWGVPLIADFPCYRLSHDYFTHTTSKLLGGDKNAFYASPAVSHLELWRSPQNVQGWWQIELGIKQKSNLGGFLRHFLGQGFPK